MCCFCILFELGYFAFIFMVFVWQPLLPVIWPFFFSFFYSVLYFAKGHLFCRETFKIAIIEFWPKTELGNNWNHVCHPIYPTSNILRWEKKRNFFFSVKSSRIHYTVQEDAYPTEKSLNLPLVSFDLKQIIDNNWNHVCHKINPTSSIPIQDLNWKTLFHWNTA